MLDQDPLVIFGAILGSLIILEVLELQICMGSVELVVICQFVLEVAEQLIFLKVICSEEIEAAG